MHGGIGRRENAGRTFFPNPGVNHPLRFRGEVSSLRGTFALVQIRAHTAVRKHAEICVTMPLRQCLREGWRDRLPVYSLNRTEQITDADQLVAPSKRWILLVKQDLGCSMSKLAPPFGPMK